MRRNKMQMYLKNKSKSINDRLTECNNIKSKIDEMYLSNSIDAIDYDSLMDTNENIENALKGQLLLINTIIKDIQLWRI